MKNKNSMGFLILLPIIIIIISAIGLAIGIVQTVSAHSPSPLIIIAPIGFALGMFSLVPILIITSVTKASSGGFSTSDIAKRAKETILSALNSSSNSKAQKCEYCGSTIDNKDNRCASCGARNTKG